MKAYQGFFVSWMIGTITAVSIGVTTAQPLTVYPAVELEFPTEAIRTYQLERSLDLTNWEKIAGPFDGTGEPFIQLVSTRRSGSAFYRLQITDRTSGLAAYYPFNGRPTDASINHNDGTAFGVGLTTNRFGEANAAYRFGGHLESYIQIPDSPSLTIGQNITLAAWINFEVGGTDHPRILQKGDYELFTYETTENRRLAFSVKGVGLVATPAELLQAGRWTFVAGTYDGHSLRLFIDAQLVAEVAGNGPLLTSAVELNLGRNAQNSSDSFAGILDDIRIFNRALGAAEVGQLYNRKD
jgi:hypothetical protein